MRSIYNYIKCLERVKAELILKKKVEAESPRQSIASEAQINLLTIIIRDLDATHPMSSIVTFWNEVS